MNNYYRIAAGLALLALLLIPANVFADGPTLNRGVEALTVGEVVVIAMSAIALAIAVSAVVVEWRRGPADTRSLRDLDHRIAETVAKHLRDEELNRALRALTEQQALHTQIALRNYLPTINAIAEWTPTEIDDVIVQRLRTLLADTDTRGTVPPTDLSPDGDDSPMAGPESGF